jgi:hypothetical protein
MLRSAHHMFWLGTSNILEHPLLFVIEILFLHHLVKPSEADSEPVHTMVSARNEFEGG